MPTKTDRIEPGIYRVYWIGDVTIQEIFQARDEINMLAADDNITRYIGIIDGTQTQSLPLDLRMLTRSVNEGAIVYLVLNAPMVGEMMGRMFNQFAPMPVEFYKDRDELMARAHVLLGQLDEPMAE